AHAAGDEHGAGRQQRGDLGQRIGFARNEERERRFRPDQVRDVADAGGVRPGGAVRQGEIAAHDVLLGAVVELLVLLQVGLHDARGTVLDDRGRGRGERPGPGGAGRRQQGGRGGGGGGGTGGVGAFVRQHRGSREHGDRHEGQPPQAEERGALRQRQGSG